MKNALVLAAMLVLCYLHICFVIGFCVMILIGLVAKRLQEKPSKVRCAIWYDPIAHVWQGSRKLYHNPTLSNWAYVVHCFETDSPEHFETYVQEFVQSRESLTPVKA